MSVAHSSPLPAADAGRRTRLVRRLAGATTAVAVSVGIAVAVWPASEADKARADGEQFGAAVYQLQTAQTGEEVDAALSDVHDAAADTREHAGDAVADQVDEQADALSRAADGFVGVHSSDDAFSVDVYQAELNEATDDLDHNASEFRSTGPEVQQAFWDGYETGVAGE
jgi:hypothetical protein